MARSTNAIVTFDDLIYMANNENYFEVQPITSSNRCPTKSELIANLYVYEPYISNYANNQLVAYDDLVPGAERITLLQGNTDKDLAYNETTILGEYWFRTLSTYPNVGDIIYTNVTGSGTYTQSNTSQILYHRIGGSDIIISINPTNGSVIDRKDMSQTLSISPTVKSVNSSQNTFSVSVTSNSNWEVLESTGWFSVSATSGSGNGGFSVTVDPNSGSERTNSLTVRNPDGANSIQLSITQASDATTYPIDLSYDSSSTSNVCAFSRNLSRYIDDSSFNAANQLYRNSLGDLETISGYYSDNQQWRYWDASSQTFTSNGLCTSGF